MDVRRKALTVLSIGLLLLALGLYVPGNPRAPFSSGGIPLPFFTGIGAGYAVGGGMACVVSTTPRTPEFRQLFRASFLSVPVAFLASLLIQTIEVETVSSVGRFLAFHVGLAVLFYPVAFGFVFGVAPDRRDRPVVGVIAASLLVAVSVAAIIRPAGLGAAVLFVGFWVVILADLVFSYPLYRLGLELTSETAAR